MYYKPDWEQARARLEAWWNHEVIDRCCIAVHAPKDGAQLPPFPDLQHGPWLGGLDQIRDDDHEGIKHWWVDPELNYQRAMLWFENAHFGGEALPVTYANWGAMALAAMFGSKAEFNKSSVWYSAALQDWDGWEWQFDAATDETWLALKAIVERFVEDAPGRYFVGKPELGNGADVLSLLRGMDNLAVDLILNPEQVKQGVDIISDTWVALMEEAYQMTTDVNDGGDCLAWMGLWAPGRTDQIACDFSVGISPQMFEEFFIPEILKMGDWCEYGTYHLDGQACMMNMLDILLEIDQIKTIQFTPGTGSPLPTYCEQYVPRYRRILERGKNLYLLAQPNEVERILAELPPEGLYMRTYVASEAEANDLLKKVTQWSAQGNQFAKTW